MKGRGGLQRTLEALLAQFDRPGTNMRAILEPFLDVANVSKTGSKWGTTDTMKLLFG